MTNIIVATVLTVYGIETLHMSHKENIYDMLQQYLPFTVLKRTKKVLVLPFEHVSCNSTYRLRY